MKREHGFGRELTLLFMLFLGIGYFFNILLIKNSYKYYDFGSFIAAGQLANRGENPYSDDSPLIFRVTLAGNGISGAAPNLNPPISVLLFQQIANFDPDLSILVWRILTILFYLASLYLLNVSYPVKKQFALLRFVGALGLAGFWHTIQLGQLYTIILLILVITWLLMKQKRWVIAGIFLGILIAIKPNFVIWAFLLLFAGYWRTFLTAGFTASMISGLPLITHGLDIYLQWLEAASIFTPNLLLFPANNSFQSLAARLGYPALGIGLSLVLVLGAYFHVYKSRPDTDLLNTLGIITCLLVSPISWTGYTILTLPYFFSKYRWGWALWAAAVIFLVPFLIPLWLFQTSFLNFVIFGCFYGWGLLCLLFDILESTKNDI